MMTRLACAFPGYGWDHNFGYGTAEHQAALEAIGATRHHRRSFAPVLKVLQMQARISHRKGCIGPRNLRKFFCGKGLPDSQTGSDANTVYL
jgi:hypothetical protein